MPGSRTLLRRLAPVFAAAQLAVLAVVPVVEALFEHPSGPPAVEEAHERCAPVHRAASCPACALAGVRARPAERVRLAVAGTESVAVEQPLPSSVPPRAPPRAVRSRAPPSLA